MVAAAMGAGGEAQGPEKEAHVVRCASSVAWHGSSVLGQPGGAPGSRRSATLSEVALRTRFFLASVLGMRRRGLDLCRHFSSHTSEASGL